MATIRDVAQHAGVSVSTVSYVINGTRPISEATVTRVRAAMDELGYRPHALARGLATRRSRIIGLLFPTPERGLGVTELEFVTSVAEACRAVGYQMILWTAEVHERAELKALTGAGLVDGVIVMEIRLDDDRIGLLRDAGLPFRDDRADRRQCWAVLRRHRLRADGPRRGRLPGQARSLDDRVGEPLVLGVRDEVRTDHSRHESIRGGDARARPGRPVDALCRQPRRRPRGRDPAARRGPAAHRDREHERPGHGRRGGRDRGARLVDPR